MKMSKIPNEEKISTSIQNLGFYLPIIRNGLGWSLENLGDKLYVNKQTIANIEKQAKANVTEEGEMVENIKQCMTYAQYFTLRMIIQDEIESMPQDSEDTKRLKFILTVLVDENMDGLNEEQKEQLKGIKSNSFINAAASVTTALGIVNILPILGIMNPLTAPIIGTVAGIPFVVSALLGKKSKDKKK